MDMHAMSMLQKHGANNYNHSQQNFGLGALGLNRKIMYPLNYCKKK